jgi:hypothetical protein
MVREGTDLSDHAPQETPPSLPDATGSTAAATAPLSPETPAAESPQNGENALPPEATPAAENAAPVDLEASNAGSTPEQPISPETPTEQAPSTQATSIFEIPGAAPETTFYPPASEDDRPLNFDNPEVGSDSQPLANREPGQQVTVGEKSSPLPEGLLQQLRSQLEENLSLPSEQPSEDGPMSSLERVTESLFALNLPPAVAQI